VEDDLGVVCQLHQVEVFELEEGDPEEDAPLGEDPSHVLEVELGTLVAHPWEEDHQVEALVPCDHREGVLSWEGLCRPWDEDLEEAP